MGGAVGFDGQGEDLPGEVGCDFKGGQGLPPAAAGGLKLPQGGDDVAHHLLHHFSLKGLQGVALKDDAHGNAGAQGRTATAPEGTGPAGDVRTPPDGCQDLVVADGAARVTVGGGDDAGHEEVVLRAVQGK